MTKVFNVAMFLTPMAVALWMLWRNRPGAGLDGPGRLVAVAAAVLPAERRDWGRAMSAELAHIAEPGARRRFALGCVAATLSSPHIARGRVPFAVAAAAAGVAAGYALPGLRVFAVTFAVLAGVVALVTRPPAGAGAGAVVTLAGVVGCVCLAAYALAAYRIPAGEMTVTASVQFAVALAVSLWAGLLPPPSRLVAGAALSLAVVFTLAVLGYADTSNGGLPLYVLLAPAVVFAVAALVAARARSFGAGVRAALSAVVYGGLLVFAIGLPLSLHLHRYGDLVFAIDEGVRIGENLTNAIVVLALLPLWSLPFGVFGAATGRRLHRT
ncbi:hypothetical protein ACSDR0_28695 [Streptosporangium sp. G11]|uniref:hypothetical protein n=1 Tax=Streptosporangium sp. G11 TaxID=3436926 RepID=UPI003EB69BD6